MRAGRFLTLVMAVLFTAVPALAAQGGGGNTCTALAFISPDMQTVPETTNGSPTIVHLNGTPSKPNDATFSWQQISGPTVTLSSVTVSKPTFSAPQVGPSGAALVFQLTVTGCIPALTSSATTTVNVTNINTNGPPVAAATVSPSSIFEGTEVTLDGSSSSDPDHDTLTYIWSQASGTIVDLIVSGPVATFVAPNVAYPGGATLVFSLTVSDGFLTNTTLKTVNVQWVDDPPQAQLTCPETVSEGAPLTLDGTGSTDSDDGIASYAWAQLQGLPNADLPAYDLASASSISFTAPFLTSKYDTMTFKLTVTDASGQFNTRDCQVRVLDVTPPVITMPAGVTGEATSAAGAAVTYDSSAVDNVDGIVTASCTPASGSTFPIGTTAVACTATDSAGNNASAAFTVTVADTTAPAVTAPADLTVEATGPQTSVAIGTANATDAVGVVSLKNDAPASFPVGVTVVVWTAKDAAGNAGIATQTITVKDTTPPAVTAPANVTVEATGPLTTVAIGSANATDAVGVVSLTNDAPAAFPVGATVVTWTAKDAAGNAGTATQTITVTDTTPPAISGVPANKTAEATDAGGSAVSYIPPIATDLVDGTDTVVCTPSSGSTFTLGINTVVCNTADAHGNKASASFTVTVTDTTPPAISGVPANITTLATSASGAAVTFDTPSATDLVDGPVTVSCTPLSGSTFPVGASTVTCGATDKHGNYASKNFTVTVKYNWSGFYSPIDNTVVNRVKAGSAIPIKFSLGGNMGLDVFVAGYPISAVAASFNGVVEVNDITDLSTVSAGGSSLAYDPLLNQYIYVWKTDKAFAGTNRQLQVKLKDGTVHIGNFSFTK